MKDLILTVLLALVFFTLLYYLDERAKASKVEIEVPELIIGYEESDEGIVIPIIDEEVIEERIILEVDVAPLPYEDEVAISTLKYTTEYDKYFKRYTTLYLAGYDWRWLKAICITESNLRKSAVSPVGAMGLCQFMPATWKDMQRELRLGDVDAFEPETNIMAAAYYMDKMLYTWRAPRSDSDRKALANASYNAGAGNIIKSQSLCGNPPDYLSIIFCLERVTGHHHIETVNYVQRIRNVEKELSY